ncbi:MAG: hypothetical protein IKJ00_04920 [Clostridia bacterium]|nr:hypothetical protein [Clostridia bacterium]
MVAGITMSVCSPEYPVMVALLPFSVYLKPGVLSSLVSVVSVSVSLVPVSVPLSELS